MSLTWPPISADSDFTIHNLPYGVFSRRGDPPRVGVAIGDFVLDVCQLHDVPYAADFATDSLNAFMARGRTAWSQTRMALVKLLTDETERKKVDPHLVPLAEVSLHLPFAVADYVDFYSSEHHAANVGSIFRPGQAPLTPNWKHLPIGYHGRAGTIVVSDTPVVRPSGQRRPEGEDAPAFGPSQRLDIEAEVGFVIGVPSTIGKAVPSTAFADHVFGVVLVNDWSARDIQAWEYVPLGPFLGKSFATSISAWVVPLEALEYARCTPPPPDVARLPYLQDHARWGLDIQLDVILNGELISRPPYVQMYWNAAQQLAHMTINGASLRTGDLFASGTVSGPQRDQCGSLLELTWNGREPLVLTDGSERSFLEDGDTVTIRASAAGPGSARIALGQVTATVLSAQEA